MINPSLVFLDTNIFESKAFNFQSELIERFALATKEQGLTLVIPHPIRLEIERHISEKATKAHGSLQTLFNKYPFLHTWPKLAFSAERRSGEVQLVTHARGQWYDFLNSVRHKHLDYDGVDTAVVMRRYDQKKPPFGDGSKRKEFPDAFAIAALDSYARKTNAAVAVVSHDGDLDAACSELPKLLYFKSLPSYLESLISGDTRLESAQGLCDEAADELQHWAADHFAELDFRCEDEGGEVYDVEVDKTDVSTMNVIHLGEDQIVMAFDAIVSFSAHVTIPDYDTSYRAGKHHWETWGRFTGQVSEIAELSGTLKVTVNPSWDKVEHLSQAEFDETEITVSTVPKGYEERD